MLFLLTDSPKKLKLEKIHGRFMQAGALLNFFFFLTNTKNNHSSAIDWWENTKSSLKDDARTFSENSYFFKENQNFNTEKKTAKLIQKRKPETAN